MAASQIACQADIGIWAQPIEYTAYWFTYSSANRPCGLDSLWTHVKVIHSLRLDDLPRSQQVSAWPNACRGGSQPPLLAGMRLDRGVMAVGNSPLFPSTVCQSASRKGSKSVNIFVTARESARPCAGRKRARLYFESSYLINKSISPKKACMRVLKGAIVIQRLSQHGERGDKSHKKAEDCVLSWRSGQKCCLCDACWHLGDLGFENKLCWLRTKSSQLYLHQKVEHVSHKVLYSDQRPQVQKIQNLTDISAVTQLLDVLSFTPLSEHTTRTQPESSLHFLAHNSH